MSEYKLTWVAKIERVLPSGHMILGEHLPEGRGDTPDEAMSLLKVAVNKGFEDLAEKAAVLPPDAR